MRGVIVIGPGALGLGLGYTLERLGYAPLFIGRQGPTPVAIGVKGKAHWERPRPTDRDLACAELAFVAVKAYDLPSALDHLRFLPPGIPVIFTGNGLIEATLREAGGLHPPKDWRLGLSTLAVTRNEHEIALTNPNAETAWGPYAVSTAPTLRERQLAAHAGFTWAEDVQDRRRKKWVFNTTLNTLCGAHGWARNGEALQHLPIVRLAFNEACALGEELWPLCSWETDTLWKELVDLIRATERNENSMARDVRLGRETESPYLAGLAAGREKFPLLKSLHDQILRKSAERSGERQ